MENVMARSMSKRGIRPYGPGKFSTIVDSHASAATLDGGADEEIHTDGDGYYGLVRIDKGFIEAVQKVAAEEREELTDEEVELLEKNKAVIFFERTDGIVETEWFTHLDEAEDRWAEIEEEFYDEEEGEELD